MAEFLLVKAEQESGEIERVVLNVDHIVSIQPSSDSMKLPTTIVLSGGAEIKCDALLDELLEDLRRMDVVVWPAYGHKMS